MKKWMSCLLFAGLIVGSASAAWWPFGSGEKEDEQAIENQPAPETSQQRMQQMRKHRVDGMKQRLTPEQMEKLKAQRAELMKLGEAARNETDPAKKEELVGQLRAKLTEAAEKMYQAHLRRLEHAEKEIEHLKQRAEEMKKTQSQRIEKQIERILSGEPPVRHEKGDGGPKKGPKPAPAE